MIRNIEAAILKFVKLIGKLYSHQRLSLVEADTTEIQLSNFCSSIYILQNENFSDINFKSTPIDAFLGTFRNDISHYLYRPWTKSS